MRRFATPEVAHDLQTSGFSLGGKLVARIGDVFRYPRLYFAGGIAAARGDDRAAQYVLRADVRCYQRSWRRRHADDGRRADVGLRRAGAAAGPWRERRARCAGDGRADRIVQRRAPVPPESRRSRSASASPPAKWSPGTPAPTSGRRTPASAISSISRRGSKTHTKAAQRVILIDQATRSALSERIAVESLGRCRLRANRARSKCLPSIRIDRRCTTGRTALGTAQAPAIHDLRIARRLDSRPS